MTVKEYIEQLQTLDPNMEVYKFWDQGDRYFPVSSPGHSIKMILYSNGTWEYRRKKTKETKTVCIIGVNP